MSFSKRKSEGLLIIILLIAAFLRFYRLDQVPPSPSLDEVSIGWNAYSILETNKDEYGTPFPILLRAYDDWRPALYVYLVIPFLKIFDLSTIAVRLPSVLFSLITILVVYHLVRDLFEKSEFREEYGLATAFLLAISPWHLYISRLGHEVNLGLAFSVLAIFFFVKSIKKKSKLLFVSAIFWALSFYTYQSQKLFGPFLILSLVGIFRKHLKDRKKTLILAGALGFVLLLPVIKISLKPGSLIRFQGTNLFSNQQEVVKRSSKRIFRDYQKNDFLGLIFDNRRLALGLVSLRAYFSHFNPTWLFFNQGEEYHKVPSLGLLYLWELPLIILGSYRLAKSKKVSRETKLLLSVWVLAAPLAASITTQAPHAMRAFNLLPVPQILAAVGGAALFTKFNKKIVLGLISSLVLISLAYLYHHYFINFPIEQSKSFQYPLGWAIKNVLETEDQYEKIVFSNRDNCYQSYMFFLFFSQYDPAGYLSQGGTVSGGYNEIHGFGKYEFRPIDWHQEETSFKILYVGNPDDFPPEIEGETINFLNGRPGIKLVRRKKNEENEKV